jgi:hypothetical protein
LFLYFQTTRKIWPEGTDWSTAPQFDLKKTALPPGIYLFGVELHGRAVEIGKLECKGGDPVLKRQEAETQRFRLPANGFNILNATKGLHRNKPRQVRRSRCKRCFGRVFYAPKPKF